MLERTLYPACPLCNWKIVQGFGTWNCQAHPLWKEPLPPLIIWMSCENCGHIFTDGYFEGEALQVLLSSGQEAQKVHVNENERFIASLLIDKVAAPQESFANPAPSWLDVGFGSGALVMTAQEYGYDAVGLDLRQQNVEALHNLGYTAFQTTIEEYVGRSAGRDKQFDVISILEVLEHMPFPREALDAAHSLLVDDGVLVVSCPNMDTALWRSMDGMHYNPYWLEIEHYHNFTRKTLSQLLDAHGFVPVSYHVSPRYKSCCEIISMKKDRSS
jgi:protein O-GlcNAc transferase